MSTQTDNKDRLRSTRPPYAPIWHDMLFDKTLSGDAIKLYGILDRRVQRNPEHDKYGHSWPGREWLADVMGVSTRTVDRLLQILYDKGWLSVQRQPQGATNLYTLHWMPVGNPERKARPSRSDSPDLADHGDSPPLANHRSCDSPNLAGLDSPDLADKRAVSERDKGSSKEEPRARADFNDGTEPEQPTGPSSASERIPDQPRAQPEGTDQRARVPESDQLFGSADSSAGAADCPPQVAPPPPKGKRRQYDAEFEDWWSRYVRRGGDKAESAKQYWLALKRASAADLAAAADEWSAYWREFEIDNGFRLAPERWLRKDRWLVDPEDVHGRRADRERRERLKPVAKRQTAEEASQIAYQALRDLAEEQGYRSATDVREVAQLTHTPDRRTA